MGGEKEGETRVLEKKKKEGLLGGLRRGWEEGKRYCKCIFKQEESRNLNCPDMFCRQWVVSWWNS